MQIRVYRVGTKNRLATVALIAAALAVGAVLIAFGLMLLLALTAAGVVVGSGVMLYRRLTGRGPVLRGRQPQPGLDPSLEVFAGDAPSLSASASPASSVQPPADHPASSASDTGPADPSERRSSSSARSSPDRA